MIGEHLRLVFETSESAGVNDAVTIALEAVAIRVLGFLNAAPARACGGHSPGLS
jgi:hypothetical protein